MSSERLALGRQIEMIFQTLYEELRHLPSGTIFVQIRADVVGKYGIRHPSEKAAVTCQESYMTASHLKAFTELAAAAMDYKKGWTHGEIFFKFAMKNGVLCASVMFR